jgi:uncharacterized membrane-anchored protein
MITAELRNKWQKSIQLVDNKFLRMIDSLYETYINEGKSDEVEVPEIFQKLIEKGLEDSKSGRGYVGCYKALQLS